LLSIVDKQIELGLRVGIAQSQVARLNGPPDEIVSLLHKVSVAFAKELQGMAQTKEMPPLVEGVLPGEKRRLAILLANPSEHPLMDLAANVIQKIVSSNDFEVFVYAYEKASGQLAKELEIAVERIRRKHWVEFSQKHDVQLLRMVRNQKIHATLDLVGMAAGNKQALLQNKPSPVVLQFLNYPALNCLDASHNYTVLDDGMASVPALEGLPGKESVAKLGCCWMNTQHPSIIARIDRSMQPPDEGCMLIGVLGSPDRIGPEGREEMFFIVHEVIRQGRMVILSIYEFPLTAYASIKNAAAEYARRNGLAEDLFCDFITSHGHKPKTAHLNRLRGEFHFLLALSSVYPAHTTLSDALVAGAVTVVSGRLAGKTCAAAGTASMMEFAGLGALVARDLESFGRLVTEFIEDHESSNGTMRKSIQLCLDWAAHTETGFFNQDRIADNLIYLIKEAIQNWTENKIGDIEAPPEAPCPRFVTVDIHGKLVMDSVQWDRVRAWKRDCSPLPAFEAVVEPAAHEEVPATEFERILQRAALSSGVETGEGAGAGDLPHEFRCTKCKWILYFWLGCSRLFFTWDE
jgi:hypothetical protein